MPDTSDELITIKEADLVESLTLAMHTEHLDDDTCNSVIATLLDAIANNYDSSPVEPGERRLYDSKDETATAAFSYPSDSIEAQRWL